ncbi:hypothetical protein P12x_002483 [Tundrisphaera lichenicola]|uniref:hypothetical protein n=1 Tax=Tundrisphaera lichenicola TaxID=2029860 RepID=UPI003EC0FA97
MSDERIKIRCPNCQRDGKARAEHINRRVNCKYCSHVFRVTPIEDSAESATATEPAPPSKPKPGSAASGRHAARQRIEGLEEELKKLRDDLSAQSAEQPAFGWAEAQLATLREELDAAREEARKSAGRLQEAEAARARSEQAHHAEAEALREEARKASLEHAEREKALKAEVEGLRDQLDETIQAAPPGEATRAIEDELRKAREELARARESAEATGRDHQEAISAIEARQAQALAEIQGRLDRAADDARTLRDERDQGDSEKSKALDELRAELSRSRTELGEAESIREDRDRIAGELEAIRGRLEEAERKALEVSSGRESEVQALREELASARDGLREAEAAREQIAQARLEEAESARRELEEARAKIAEARARNDTIEIEADAVRRERDEVRILRDRAVDELEQLRARVEAAEGATTEWGFDSTEMEVPHFQDMAGEIAAHAQTKMAAETETLRAELAEVREHALHEDARLAEMTTTHDSALASARAETEGLRASLAEALAATEAANKARDELAARVARLEEAPAPLADASATDESRRRDVEEAVKGAWADFEARLSETQAKLRAANARADLLEAEAREAHEQAEAHRRGLDFGDGSSFEGGPSMTSIRILSDRGTTQLTPADAEARLALARQLAVERKDRTLIDRISKMTQKVRDDLDARNFTLAETLVRGAEIEVGLDPGGYSIGGLKIFRPSPSIVNSMAALEPALERVMKQGELSSIESTLGEFRMILGEQAGLPEIRRPGRTPAVKRTIAPAEAVRLFLGAIEAEQWLIRPIAAKRPLPDTTLATYATLIEACSEIRPSVEQLAPDKLGLLDQILQAAIGMLIRRQQPDGHFPFLDPRGKPSKLATVVEAMVARNPSAVKDGWVVAIDPSGIAQIETAHCSLALLKAGNALGKPELTQDALKAADWAAGQPPLINFVANARSASSLARAYQVVRQDRHRDALAARLRLGLLPGQVENGRWIDPVAAQTPDHLTILQALQDAWEALPDDLAPLRDEVKESLDRALDSFLEECQALGVPAQGGSLRTLIRQRDLTRPGTDPRLESAIADSVTLIQELCHDGGKPKLGVPADQLTALVRV